MVVSSKARHRSRNVSFCSLCVTAVIAAAAVILILEISSSKKHHHSELTGYRIVKEYSHDPDAFTQGLLYYGNDTFYESTGIYGMSSVREVQLQTGKVNKMYRMQKSYFGEGLVLWQDRLLQVAWLTNKGFVYERNTIKPLGTFTHPMQDGWGLTHDGKHIIGSDGSSKLYFLNPDTFTEVRRVSVQYNGQDVKFLNELEYVKGEVWANVWMTECIARISPDSGKVLGWIILQGLRNSLVNSGNKNIDVLNGIAWDSERDRLFVTGKLWPKMYEIALEPMSKQEKVNPSICINHSI